MLWVVFDGKLQNRKAKAKASQSKPKRARARLPPWGGGSLALGAGSAGLGAGLAEVGAIARKGWGWLIIGGACAVLPERAGGG